ncbi:heparan-alpha-glucosaminide N-acetyltransferase [Methanoregula sp.]|uniref:heparan-alpha-glucosaminide N-acetyltransferase n=1 Tax=Methanoregula sp. TaxID=2052170 RepID=UPI0035655530
MDKGSRLWEIDCARGIAIIMMVVFHTVFDLSFFGIAPVEVGSGFWRGFAFATATLFLLVVGVSLVVSHAKAVQKLSGAALIKKFVFRGAGIFALGLLVTLATYLYLHEGFVVFGILHLIGVAVMFSPFLFRFGKKNILIGSVIVLAGLCLHGISGPAYLIPLGIYPVTFYSVDYTPLLPWLGVVLIGLGIGEFLYRDGIRQFPVRNLPDLMVTPLSFLGRHSLIIYLVHQPVIILLLTTIAGIPLF